MTDLVLLDALSPDSRSADHPVAAVAEGRAAVAWREFSRSLDVLRAAITGRPEPRWALHTEDHALFLLGFLALLRCGREVHLPPLVPPAAAGEALPLLSDSAPHAAIRLAFGGRTASRAGADWPRIDPGAARIVFHTSGSTGAPKLVPKNLIQVENEIAVLASLWGGAFRGATVFSTVSPLHFYGFLFTALLPFALGAEISGERVRFPEALESLSGRPTVLVTSPAFLKRLGDGPAVARPRPAPGKIFSSGGFLPEPAALTCLDLLGAPVHEIYGSTETGGIAWRVSPPLGDDFTPPAGRAPGFWTLFPGVTATGIDERGFTVASPYLPAPGAMRIEDRIEIEGDDRIRLLGRTDSIVKIEEKRVALNEVENHLFATGLVEDAVVLALEAGRQYLAAAVVLNNAGREKFRGKPKSDVNRFFKDALRAHFEPLVIPRKWRFPESIPRNSQGKIDRDSARGLFTAQESPRDLPQDIDSVRERSAQGKKDFIAEPSVLNRKESPGKIELTLNFPARYVHFQGHFPGMPLLPAVVQVDWAVKFARRAFGAPPLCREIPRMKCVKPIFPDKPVLLALEYDADRAQLAFSYSDPADGSLYSQGKILQGAP